MTDLLAGALAVILFCFAAWYIVAYRPVPELRAWWRDHWRINHGDWDQWSHAGHTWRRVIICGRSTRIIKRIDP